MYEIQHEDFSIQQVQNLYKWSQHIFTPSMGYVCSYSIGQRKHKSNEKKYKILKKIYRHLSIPLQSFLQRNKKLLEFQHQNYLKSKIGGVRQRKYKNTNTNKQITVLFNRQFSVYTHYLENYKTLQSLIDKKQKLSKSNMINLIVQFVDIMLKAESNKPKGFNHQRLNSNAILIKYQNQIKGNINENKIQIKVCDWGYGQQLLLIYPPEQQLKFIQKLDKPYINLEYISQCTMFEYSHPELIFDPNTLINQYKSQYDIWSFGIILYKLNYSKHPFSSENTQNKIFDIKKLSEHYNNKNQYKIDQNQNFIQKFIEQILSFNLNSWQQIKNYLISNHQLTQYDFMTPSQILNHYQSIIQYFIENYKHILFCVVNSSNLFFFQNKIVCKKLLIFIVRFLIKFNQKVKQRFKRKFILLKNQQKQIFANIQDMITEQWQKYKHYPLERLQVLKKGSIFQIFQQLIKYSGAIIIRINDCSEVNELSRSSLGTRVQESWESMKNIQKFCSKFNQTIINIKNINKNIFPELIKLATNLN